jgi:hypothetical protein
VKKYRYLLICLLIVVSFVSGGLVGYTEDYDWLNSILYPPAKTNPTLTSVKVVGNVEIDLSKTGSRSDELKSLFLKQADPKVIETFRQLAHQQVASAHFQTVLNIPSKPLPLESMQLTVQNSYFEATRNRIVIPYTLIGYIVAPDESLYESLSFDEKTSEYTEVFTVPADPTNLFQRLGYACANQEGIPIGQVDDANYGEYFDPTCGPGVKTCVNLTKQPIKPCLDVLQRENGVGALTVHFKNVPYDQAIADQWKTQTTITHKGVDLSINKKDLSNYDIIYKKFEQNSCALQEKCVAGPGVRRLLRFDGSVKNIGDTDLEFGQIDQLKNTHQFSFNACHNHNHFGGFAQYSLEKDGNTIISGKKQTFCVQGTDRMRNDGTTSYSSDFDCKYQGMKAGWQDEYFKGLDCQWIDITDLPVTSDAENFQLSMEVNPLKLLCEGKPNINKYVQALDENGQKILDAQGQPILKQACDVNPELYKNNKSTVTIHIPKTGASVNDACKLTSFGSMRNCGWKAEQVQTCKAGQIVSLAQTGSNLVRACPDGVPCTYSDALASGEPNNTKFTCPKEGSYLLMTAPYVAN